MKSILWAIYPDLMAGKVLEKATLDRALALVTRKRQDFAKDPPKPIRTQVDRLAVQIEALMFQTLQPTRYFGIRGQDKFARRMATALAKRDKRIEALERALDAQRDLVATLEKSVVAGIR